jgi:hypothetical protein
MRREAAAAYLDNTSATLGLKAFKTAAVSKIKTIKEPAKEYLRYQQTSSFCFYL